MTKRLKKCFVCFSCWCMGCRCRRAVSEENFALDITTPKAAISVGEAVIYTAELENWTGRAYELYHAMLFVSLYVYPAGETPQDVVGTTSLTTTISGGGAVMKTLSVQFDEPGDYVLRAFCVFEIGKKRFGLVPIDSS